MKTNNFYFKCCIRLSLLFVYLIFRIRLREGFKFAHSSAGIINMVLEVDMIEVSIPFTIFL